MSVELVLPLMVLGLLACGFVLCVWSLCRASTMRDRYEERLLEKLHADCAKERSDEN